MEVKIKFEERGKTIKSVIDIEDMKKLFIVFRSY